MLLYKILSISKRKLKGKNKIIVIMIHLSLDDNQNYILYLPLIPNQLWITFAILFEAFTVEYIAS